ncbi:MAG: hypothetical protein KR126chlam1_00864 [Chlamydiae bacterium]|nr:hypothetical protein [Chlamydiota bacterium]
MSTAPLTFVRSSIAGTSGGGTRFREDSPLHQNTVTLHHPFRWHSVGGTVANGAFCITALALCALSYSGHSFSAGITLLPIMISGANVCLYLYGVTKTASQEIPRPANRVQKNISLETVIRQNTTMQRLSRSRLDLRAFSTNLKRHHPLSVKNLQLHDEKTKSDLAELEGIFKEKYEEIDAAHKKRIEDRSTKATRLLFALQKALINAEEVHFKRDDLSRDKELWASCGNIAEKIKGLLPFFLKYQELVNWEELKRSGNPGRGRRVRTFYAVDAPTASTASTASFAPRGSARRSRGRKGKRSGSKESPAKNPKESPSPSPSVSIDSSVATQPQSTIKPNWATIHLPFFWESVGGMIVNTAFVATNVALSTISLEKVASFSIPSLLLTTTLIMAANGAAFAWGIKKTKPLQVEVDYPYTERSFTYSAFHKYLINTWEILRAQKEALRIIKSNIKNETFNPISDKRIPNPEILQYLHDIQYSLEKKLENQTRDYENQHYQLKGKIQGIFKGILGVLEVLGIPDKERELKYTREQLADFSKNLMNSCKGVKHQVNVWMTNLRILREHEESHPRNSPHSPLIASVSHAHLGATPGSSGGSRVDARDRRMASEADRSSADGPRTPPAHGDARRSSSSQHHHRVRSTRSSTGSRQSSKHRSSRREKASERAPLRRSLVVSYSPNGATGSGFADGATFTLPVEEGFSSAGGGEPFAPGHTDAQLLAAGPPPASLDWAKMSSHSPSGVAGLEKAGKVTYRDFDAERAAFEAQEAERMERERAARELARQKKAEA